MHDILSKMFKQEKTPVPSMPAPDPEPRVNITDPQHRRQLDDFFKSAHWPIVRDLLNSEIILFQSAVDKQLQGALSDPKDFVGRMAAFHGGRIRAGEEFRSILTRLKSKYGPTQEDSRGRDPGNKR